MFRWPIEFTPLSHGSNGSPRAATLEITPRGAVFTLAALSHVGHPAHLAVLDAYVKGQVRQTASTSIGEDSRLVLSSLAAPLVAAHDLGIERLTLADLILLPRATAPDPDEPPEGSGWTVRGPDSARFLLRSPSGWVWVRAAERFEPAGCLGTPRPGVGSPWHDVFVQAGEHPPADPVAVEVREPTEQADTSAELVSALATLGLARFARAPAEQPSPPDPPSRKRERGGSIATDRASRSTAQLDRGIRAEIAGVATPALVPVFAAQTDNSSDSSPSPASGRGGWGVRDLGPALAESIAARMPTELAASWRGRELHVSLAPDLDGYQTLCLLPPARDPASITKADPSSVFEMMRDAAWAAIESLIGRPHAEYRTEPIALRLVAYDGRTTTLDAGVSIVIVRNQTVFTGWVGSDGRVMLKLFPAGGMAAR